jgi:hypothetical protein
VAVGPGTWHRLPVAPADAWGGVQSWLASMQFGQACAGEFAPTDLSAHFIHHQGSEGVI